MTNKMLCFQVAMIGYIFDCQRKQVQGSNQGFKKEIPHSNLKQCHLLVKKIF